MARLGRTSDARNDLTAIWLYIAQNNLSAAGRLMDEINHTLKLLLRFPLMGEAVDHLRP
jgi:plasmid stabilization system protein ParE